ncbi:MAG: zinc-regulated TonB-dependent outer membrane receptor [Kiritimatiellae bacterium]|nr:zinc-regulated TonB-dependent outer membrane receptor [Kiritimatiellia bacterium]
MKNTCSRTRALVAGAAFSLSAAWAPAQTGGDARYQKLEDEVRALRQQMTTMQEQHSREMAELKALFQKQAAAPADTPQTPIAQGAAAPATSLYESIKQSAEVLVPQSVDGKNADLDLSVVLDMYFYHDDTSEGVSHLKEHLRGFGHRHDGQEDHHHGSENGFNLRHVELSLSAEVDPYFRAWTTVAVDEDGAEFEEAVLQTTSLPYGLTLSGGKIKSGIGRINRQHSHNWDFWDQPLVYDLFFGAHGLSEKGVQLTWLAPTPFYLLFGTEVFNGDNEHSFSMSDADNMPQHDAPRLYTAFMKTGPDLGPNNALQFGLSALSGRHQVWDEDEDAGADGHARIFGTDFVYKYDAKRSHGEGDFILQGEYFYRDQDLDDPVGAWRDLPAWTMRQDGYYVQGLYGFLPCWRTGLRWDQVGLINDVQNPEEGDISCGDSYRLAAMLDWKLSEFSLLRFQAGHGWYATEDGREDAWECALQWQVTFGEHGAHDF